MRTKRFFRVSFESILSNFFWLVLAGLFIFLLAFIVIKAVNNAEKGWNALYVFSIIVAVLVIGYPTYLFGIQPAKSRVDM